MKYSVILLNAFKKDLKRVKKRGCNLQLLQNVVELLQDDKELPLKYRDHILTGNHRNFRECHILPDWLLIYKKDYDKLILVLTRTGTHSDLFK